MKYLTLVLLTIFVITDVRGFKEDCSEERAEACIDSLLSAILDDSTEEEVCGELRISTDCLRKAVDDCVSEDEKEEVEKGLQELEDLLKGHCKTENNNDDSRTGDEEESEGIDPCLEENEDYIMDCMSEGFNATRTFLEKGENDQNLMMCAMYGVVAGCVVERVGEKCGETAAKAAEEELSDLPAEISDACEAAGGIETHIFNLLDDKRKK